MAGHIDLPTRGLTFRVRGVPLDWDIDRLKSLLADKVGPASPIISSLALEIHGRSRTATVSFQTPPTRDFLLIPLGEAPNPLTGPQSLSLDDGFFGITTLFVPPSQDHKVDIIAISGLGGHAFGSFKQRGGEHMWLRDALPHHIIQEGDQKPCARVMIYGYDSSLPQSQSTQTLEDLATSFHNSILHLVSTPQLKPIIFIAHSLGGLVLKQVLISLSTSSAHDDKKILRAVYGIVFFGVPHNGMAIGSLIPMVGDGPNRALLESIGDTSSPILNNLRRNFNKALGSEGESEIVCFYETQESPTAIQDTNGKWKMEGPTAVLVTKASATHCRPWEDDSVYTCALNRTHSNMVKFAPQDEEYDKVIARIKGIVHHALAIRLPHLSESSQRCLRSLNFKEMDTRLNDIDDALDGTCQWLLEHETYKAWAACSRGLLWIKGKPGSGKSTLLKHAYQFVTETPKIGDRALVLSFYFHGRGAEIQKTPLGLFQSLLHQILRQVPDVLSNLVDTYEKRLQEKGNLSDAWEWHANELWDFFDLSLPRILQTRSVWLFVDALDESGEENARDLFRRFKSLLLKDHPSTCLPVRICLSCRHYPILDQDCQFVINPESSNKKDISTYVQTGISTSDRLRQSTIPALITGRANGVFMWARLAVDEALKLDSKGRGLRMIEEKIKTLPPELDSLYSGLVADMDEIPASLKLIQWVCFATRPLSLEELRWAMILDAECPYKSFRQCENAEEYDCHMENRLKTLSRGLAEAVPSADSRAVVQFVHQSAKDFFIDKGLTILTDKLKSADPTVIKMDVTASAHHQLSRTCLRYLAMDEIGELTTDNWDTWTSKFPLIDYASTSWMVHAQVGEAGGVPQHDLIGYFDWPSEILIKRWIRICQINPSGPHPRPQDMMTLTHVVSWHGLLRPLQLLLDRGAEVDAKDGGGWTPLSWAAMGGHEAVVRLLLDRGAEVDVEDTDNCTPLSWAAIRGREALVRLLLDRGAEVNAKDKDGWTALSWAAREGHKAVVQLLLDRGAHGVESPSYPCYT